jgi:transcriptional regulator with XRE-family HTH domain
MSAFGGRLRELRREKGYTLRQLADLAGVDFTYLSKVENDRLPYTPAAETIRTLARALGVDPLDLLKLANKLPAELEALNSHAQARRFFERAQTIAASPDDWDALLDLLEQRKASRSKTDAKE